MNNDSPDSATAVSILADRRHGLRWFSFTSASFARNIDIDRTDLDFSELHILDVSCDWCIILMVLDPDVTKMLSLCCHGNWSKVHFFI